jgi:transaldolase
VEAAKIGAEIATLPFSVLEALVKHPLTDIGLDRFLKDWEKLPESARRWQQQLSRRATLEGIAS